MRWGSRAAPPIGSTSWSTARSSRARRAISSSAERSTIARNGSSTRSFTEAMPGACRMPLSPDVARMKRELANLVAIDAQNPPGHEAHAAHFLRGLLMTEGFEVALQEYKPARINVVARLENLAGPVFAFNTHMDVVPAGDGWSSDPFVLKEADGRLYGRGACDCKGPLAAMLAALRMLAADRAAWPGTLLAFVV